MSKFDWKNIMVMGAGGVGGFFGAKLTRGLGAELSLVARGKHLEVIQQSGLNVQSIDGDFTVKSAASDNPADLPKPDLILFAVKSYDTAQAIRQIEPVMNEQTQVLTLQNGIENIPKLTEAFGDERVIPGLCRIGIRIAEPGVLSHTNPGSVIVGEKDGRVSDRIRAIHEAYTKEDVDCTISDNITREIWKKFSWNAIFNMLTAAENVTTERLYDGGERQARVLKLADEIISVARAEKIGLFPEDLEKITRNTQNIGAFVTSTLHDRRVGKKLEHDAFTGALLRLGEKHSIELPEYEKLHRELDEVGKV